jgi:hypothetical protein
VTVSGRSVHIDLAHPAQFRLAMSLFLPGTLASVLAGVMSGTSWVDADPQPAATRILMIRMPDATAAALEASNRYLEATEPLLGDLAALGLRVVVPAELDALLEGCLAAHRPSGYMKVGAEEYSRGWRRRSTACSSRALRGPACGRSRRARGAPRKTWYGSYGG